MSKPGDRALSIFMSEEKFYFGTYNSESNNVYKSIDHEDIEGVWSFVYYSYSTQYKKAVGYIKIGGLAMKHVTIETIHKKSNYLLFTFAGK